MNQIDPIKSLKTLGVTPKSLSFKKIVNFIIPIYSDVAGLGNRFKGCEFNEMERYLSFLTNRLSHHVRV